MILLTVINILFLCAFGTVPISGNDADDRVVMTKKLRKDLLLSYDKLARPTKNTSAIPVSIQFIPLYLVEMDEKTGTVIMNAWIPMMWRDYRVKWNPNDYSDMVWAFFGYDELWNPNIVVVNCFPITDAEPWHKSHLILSHLGIVYQARATTIRARCPKFFEQDEDNKSCNITIGAWNSKGNELQLLAYWSGVMTEEFKNNNSIWEVTDMDIYFENYQSNPMLSSMIIINLNLKRRFHFTKQVINGPHTVAILLILAMFWLPPNSYKKINLGCLVLLLLSGLMLYMSSVKTSSNLPIAVAPLRKTLLIVASALLIEIVILNISRLNVILDISPTLIRILSGMVGRVIGVCPPQEFSDDKEMTNPSENFEELTTKKRDISAGHWFIIAISLDRIFFVIYLIIILIV